MSSTYSITLTGIKSGIAKETAIKQLAGLLKVSEGKAASLLESQKFVVKSGVDLKTAARYEDAFQECGCTSIVEPEDVDKEQLTFDLPDTRTQENTKSQEVMTDSIEQSWNGFIAKSASPKKRALFIALALGVLVILVLKNFKAEGDVVGSWNCSSSNPAQTTTHETVEFDKNGEFMTNGDDGTTLRGSYARSGRDITLTVTNASQRGVSVSTNAIVDLTVTKLTNDALNYISVIKRSGHKRTNECSKN